MARISKITAEINELYNEEFPESYDEKISKNHKMVMLPSGVIFETIIDLDKRQSSKIKHPITHVLFMIFVGMLCKVTSFGELAGFVKWQKGWFETFINLPHGTPSADTFRRVVNFIRPDLFQNLFRSVISELAATNGGDHIAVDGKSIVGYYPSKGNRILHSVSLWMSEAGLSLGQLSTTSEDGKEISEQKIIPKLLEMFDIRDKVITIDAGGCYKPIAQKIVEYGADFIIALKKNQKLLYEYAESRFDNDTSAPEISTENRGHGRHETRIYTQVLVPENEPLVSSWPNLRSIVRVVSTRKIKGKTTESTRYYITSLTSDLEGIAHKIRSHWSIENTLHWSLDVTFGEDRQRTRKGYCAENLIILRRLGISALNIARKHFTKHKVTTHSIKWDYEFRTWVARTFFRCEPTIE